MKFLVTGAAGFIGANTAKKLLELGHEVIGLDNLNNYYSPALKHHRLESIINHQNYTHTNLNLEDRDGVADLFKTQKFQRVIHLGAQAGVRHSITAPFEYVDSNLVGTMTILEGCRHNEVEHLVYASSSSVYGMNPKIPFSESDMVDHPISLYAATKKSNELMAHAYSDLYKIPTTGLRFFTVYGPAGRPDMAPWLFTEAILNNKPIKLFNEGKMQRDFTYIDDIVEGIVRIQDVIPKENSPDNVTTTAPYSIYNIGNNNPIELATFIDAIEQACGKTAEKIMLPMQAGDVKRTYANIDALVASTGHTPTVDIYTGIEKFVSWYKSYHGL
ncbi:MAG: NAD-dependent epimerase [Pseudomonadales bacterium]|nr:NAD-dependent epimerase [Pseudomonadales bacterium]